MRLHLFLTGVAKGNLDLDKKLVETSKIFKEAKKISRSHMEGIPCIEVNGPIKKDIKASFAALSKKYLPKLGNRCSIP